MIIGNKLDVGDAAPPSGGKGAREVSTEEGERYAKVKGCLFLGQSRVSFNESRDDVHSSYDGFVGHRNVCQDKHGYHGSIL